MDLIVLKPNPELEALRKVEGPPDVTKYLPNWLVKGERFSMKKLAGCRHTGWSILHIIARFVDGTPVGSRADWKNFASHLGLSLLDIQRIENFCTVKGGAALEILSLYTLQDGATVARLLGAIYELERFDILLSIAPLLEDLFNGKSSDKDFQSREDSGVLSGTDSGMEIVVCGEPDLGNLESVPCRNSSPDEKEWMDLKQKNANNSDKSKLKKTVMLTFAQDGREIAYQVAERIRSLNLGIGVLILEENEDEMESCSDSIYRWFLEVDFIIPIITEGYLWRIAPRGECPHDDSSYICLDSRYARLIYVMMIEEHLRNGCLNYRVRPLVGTAGPHSLLNNPIFICRKKLNEVDQLASRLAEAKPRPLVR